ncbi:MAG: OmpA family protein [Bacteroidetes bacterium]|nr:OmpA family protein [Bacteroidota bacterium]
MHFRIIFLLLFLFFGLEGYAQTPSKQLKKAETSTKNLSYAEAIEIYDGILKKSKNLSSEELQSVKLNLAEAYYFVKDYKNAEKYYQEVLSNNPVLKGEKLKAYLRYAQVLNSNGKREESTKIYMKFNDLQDQDKRGLEFSKLYNNIDPLIRNAGSYTLEYVGINTSSPDFSPSFYKDGMVFVSSRNPNNAVKRVFKWDNSSFLDLYYLEDLKVINKEDKTAALGGGGNSADKIKSKPKTEKLGNDYYTPPTSNDANTIAHTGSELINGSKNYEETALIDVKKFSRTLNSKYHEGPCTFYDNAQKIIFTRNGNSGGGGIFGQKKEGITRLKLYSAEKKTNDWGNIKELPFNSDDYSCGHPTVDKSDKILYFVSDMPGGYGGTDLYMSRFLNGAWSKPENLGGKVNTVGNEMFPFIAPDGQLYFSSDGHPGLGDLDIFVSKTDPVSAKPVGKVRNVGAPLNSQNDDFGIITDSNRNFGYFSSNRKRGGSDDDIYKFNRIGTLYGCRDLIVNVYDKDTKKPIEKAKFNYYESTQSNNLENGITNNSGNIKLCLPADKEFVFTVQTEGYEPQSKNYSNLEASDFEPSILDIFLKKEAPKIPVLDDPVVKKEKKQGVLIQKRTVGGNSNIFRGVISGGENNEPMSAVKVKFINKCNGEVQEMYTRRDGSYEFKRDLECDYELVATRDNFATSSEIIEKAIRKTLFGKKVKPTFSLNLFDTKLYKVGDVIKLENIYYNTDDYKVRDFSKKELDKLANTLKRYPNMIIEIASHTDTRGNSSTNLALSQKRANEVRKYLLSRGVEKNRIKAVGKGETEPLNACSDGVQCTEAEHQRNRRTEFKILTIERK